MTTERAARIREPRIGMSSLEVRLYLTALLAAIYTISWRAIGGHAQPPAPAIATAPAPSAPRHVVWLDSVPSLTRPAITLPAGWRLASEPQRSAAQPARVIRAPARRVPRVRTRSS